MVKNRLVIFIIMINMLSACGFKLANTRKINLCKQHNFIILEPINSYTPFMKQLRFNLQQMGCYTPNSDSDISFVLNIKSHDFQERILAYGKNGKPHKALLSLQIEYQLTQSVSNKLLKLQKIIASREYTKNLDTLLGNKLEIEAIKEELNFEIIKRLFNQLECYMEQITN